MEPCPKSVSSGSRVSIFRLRKIRSDPSISYQQVSYRSAGIYTTLEQVECRRARLNKVGPKTAWEPHYAERSHLRARRPRRSLRSAQRRSCTFWPDFILAGPPLCACSSVVEIVRRKREWPAFIQSRLMIVSISGTGNRSHRVTPKDQVFLSNSVRKMKLCSQF